MNKLITRVLLSAMIVAGVACSQHPGMTPDSQAQGHASDYQSRIINQPFQQVWDNLVQYLETKQVQLKIRKQESGFIDTGYMQVPGRELAMYAWTQGRRPNQVESQGRIKATLYLWKISDNQTLITMNTRVEVYENPTKYSDGGWLYANSTGRFESQVLTGFLQNQELAEGANQK